MLTKQQIESLDLKPGQKLIVKKNYFCREKNSADKFLVLDTRKAILNSGLTEEQKDKAIAKQIKRKPKVDFLYSVMNSKSVTMTDVEQQILKNI